MPHPVCVGHKTLGTDALLSLEGLICFGEGGSKPRSTTCISTRSVSQQTRRLSSPLTSPVHGTPARFIVYFCPENPSSFPQSCIGFTKKQDNQIKTTCYAQASQIRAVRKKMCDIMSEEASKCDLRELVLKL